MGGDANAGWRLNHRFTELGLAVDALQMDAFRLANAKDHAHRLVALQAAQARAAAEAERTERQQHEAAQRAPQPQPVR